MKLESVLNLADTTIKRKLLILLGGASGPHEIKIKPWRPRRSNQANAFWWAVIVTSFKQYLEDQGDVYSDEQVHDLIVRNCLGEREAINSRTGEIIGTVRKETHTLNKEDFGALIERATAWLSDFGIIIPSPDSLEAPCRATQKRS